MVSTPFNIQIGHAASTREIDIPVTRGGKIFCSTRGETKDMKISRNEQIIDVPRWGLMRIVVP